MLDRFFMNPVLPAQDGDRARAFYRDVLSFLVEGMERSTSSSPERL